MSLKAWYPFQNNFNNQGVGDLNLTQVTEPTYVTGPAGKALSAGAFQWTAAQTASILNNTALTIAFWIYVKDATDRKLIFGNESMPENNNRKFSIFQYPTVNDMHLSWQNDAANTTWLSCVLTGVFPTGKWTHVCITYQNPKCVVYINGENVWSQTGVSASSSFSYQTNVVHNSASRYLYDMRFYDNCLSASEVEKLSRGLVCHWTLYDQIGNPNLVTMKKSDWVLYGWVGNGNLIQQEPYMFLVKNGDGWCNLLFNSTALVGKTFTVSCDVMIDPDHNVSDDKGLIFGFDRRVANTNTGSRYSNGTVTIKETGKWIHVQNTFSNLPEASPYVGFYMRSVTSDAVTNKCWVYVRNIKYEEGTEKTSWCPNSAEDAYAAMNTGANVEYDISGFVHNMTGSGHKPLYSSDSIKYPVCSKFAGTVYFMGVDIAAPPRPTATITVSAWFNSDVTSGTRSILECFEGGGVGLYTSSNSVVFQIYSGGYVNVSTTFTANRWYHVVGTYDGENLTIYLDGESKASTPKTGAISYNATTPWAIGINPGQGGTNGGEQFQGRISDVRIYATALSSTAVASLYNK